MLNTKARGLLTTIIIIALSSLFLRFFILRLIQMTIEQNEANAKETLQLVSTALENYAHDHNATYPVTISLLLKNKPAYIDRDYITSSYKKKGYIYACPRMEASGYSCSAIPTACGLSGKKKFTISTAQVLVTEDCTRNE